MTTSPAPATRWTAPAARVTLVLVLVGLVFASWMAAGRRGSEHAAASGTRVSATPTPRHLLGSASPPYTSAADGFTVAFPIEPTITHDTNQISGATVPFTIYAASTDMQTNYRAVIVYDYTSTPAVERAVSLEGALAGVIQNLPGARLLASAPVTLDGHAALAGDYTAPVGSQTIDFLITITKVGHRLYAVTSAGLARADFEAFAGTFHVTLP